MTQTPQTSPELPGDDHLLALWRFDQTGRLKPGTCNEYSRYLGYLANDIDGGLLAATTVDIKTFLLGNSNRWQPATLNFARRAYRSFYRWAVEENILDENPALPIRAFKEPMPPVRVADDSIRKALMKAALSVRDQALVAVLFGTGMRRGELCSLTISDVDLEAGTLLIRTSKTGKSRVVPVDPEGEKWLRRWMKDRARVVARFPAADSDALWLNYRGEPLGYSGSRQVFRRLAERAGVTFSSHDARRGFATGWLRAGGSETALQSLCGWANLGMVGRYSRMNAADLAIDEARRMWGRAS